jgi:proteasome accessory factor A
MRRPGDPLPVLCGADVELANFIVGIDGRADTARTAARLLLHEIPGPYARPSDPLGWGRGWDPQDTGRKFLRSNGSCFYIDLDHLECCIPEVLSAWDHVAAWHATLRIAAQALADANAKLPDGCAIQLLANNSDGLGHSYGSHCSFLVPRTTWDNVFERKLHHLLVMASFLASSVVVTGAGKVGAENGRPAVAYQLSQRADFFEALVGPQTTFHRPLVNSRDEPLCGVAGAPARTMARLHCIFFDATLAHGSTLLKVGTMQLLLGMLAREQANPRLILDDPVAAVVAWSHDPTLAARARTVAGRHLTAVEMQLAFLEEARRCADTGGYEGIVPRAGELLAYWEDTLVRLRGGDVASLASRLDWVAKRAVIEQAMAQRPGLAWTDSACKLLDHLYASVDPACGLHWARERAGEVEHVVPAAAIERLVHHPPADTRAWGRAMLQRLGGGRVVDVDWDRVAVRGDDDAYWPRVRTVRLDDPLGSTRADLAPLIDGADSLDDLLDVLDAVPAADEPAAASPLPPELPATNGTSEPMKEPDHEHP